MNKPPADNLGALSEIETTEAQSVPEQDAAPDIYAEAETVAKQESAASSSDKNSASQAAQRSVAKSAGIVSLAVMGSRLLGLVREMVFAAKFGAGFLFDAFQVGFTIPNTLRDLFAEGALSAAFVKTFTDYQINRSEEEAWRLASLVLNALAIVLSIITILGIIFSPQIVAWIAPGFDPQKQALAATLTQIMFPFILLVALAAVAMGVLNTKGRFGIPASASTMFNVGSIIAGLAFAYWLSGGGWEKPSAPDVVPDVRAQWAIIGMAIGTLIGGALQFLIQVPSLYRVGFRFHPLVSFRDEGVRRVMRLMGPAIIGTSAVQINVLVNTYFASSIEGGRSWLSYAFRLMQFPIGVFGVAIGTATIPTLSRFAAKREFGEFRSTLANSIGLVFLLTVPSACGLVFLGTPIIRLIYERGAFHALDTQMVALALAAYSIGLAGYAAIKVLSPAFYALDDARTPMTISLFSIIVNGIANYFFRNWLSHYGVTPQTPSGYAHIGLALSTSCVALINFFALFWLMRRKVKRLDGRKIFASFIKIAAASALMSATCVLVYRLLAARIGTAGLTVRLLETLAPIFLGGLVFILSARLLGVSELRQAQETILRRFRRRAA